jgi:hypothetical protein
MSTTSDPTDPNETPRSLQELRELHDLSLSETSGKRVQLPPPSETRKTTPLAASAEARPAASRPALAAGDPGARAPITDDEYRKIRARLREDFVIIPKRLLRNSGAIVGGTLLAISLMGFVTARQAGKTAALSFMKSQLGEMVERNQEDLDLEARETLARSREAAEAALDARQQAVLLLDQMKRQGTSLDSLSSRIAKLEQAQRAAK